MPDEYRQIRERFKEDYDKLLMLVQRVARGSYVEDDVKEIAYVLNAFDKSFGVLKAMPDGLLSEVERADRERVIAKVTKSYETVLKVVNSFDSKREGKGIADYRKEIAESGPTDETKVADIELYRSDFKEWVAQRKKRVAELDVYASQLEGEIAEIDRRLEESAPKLEAAKAEVDKIWARLKGLSENVNESGS
ncbi:MAG: hypothetical protein QXU82_01280 [Candidatus Aenigmatarchaeota archaeon]